MKEALKAIISIDGARGDVADPGIDIGHSTIGGLYVSNAALAFVVAGILVAAVAITAAIVLHRKNR